MVKDFLSVCFIGFSLFISHLSDCLQNDARLVIFMFPCVQSLQLYTIMQIGIFYADSGHEKIAHTKSVSRDFMATFVMNNTKFIGPIHKGT